MGRGRLLIKLVKEEELCDAGWGEGDGGGGGAPSINRLMRSDLVGRSGAAGHKVGVARDA